jgi:thiamine biosynthesis protein ThiS
MIEVNNNRELPWQEGMTVSDVLEAMDYTYHRLIVKVNGELVRKGSYDTYTIPDEADVKVIHMVGGG